ncbi:MAG TPA: hypothetical protein VL971_08655 [Rhizomicrobium sp.]|nr:hypothetical protein [Rhizomicrobium sp.]
MLTNILSKYVDPLRAAAVARLGAGPLAGLTMVLGIAAAACIAVHLYLPGLALFVANRIGAVLAAVQNNVAAISVPDLLIYAALTFAFAIADPARALAAAFLLLGIVVLAGCAVLFGAGRAASTDASLMAGVIVFAAICWCCLQPERFSLIAYLFGLLCFPVAGTFAASSIVRRP